MTYTTRACDGTQGELGLGARVDDRAAAEARRDAGIARSSDNAGAEWRERAIGYVREWVARGNRGAFLCEDVRSFAESRGFEAPPTKKAWGAVVQRAARENIIRRAPCQYLLANSSNRSPKCAWEAM